VSELFSTPENSFSKKNKAKTMPNISLRLNLYQQALKNNTLGTIQTHDNEQKQTQNEKPLFKKC
jgi:hypothetical protein